MAARAATILRERCDRFARPVTLEMGKLIAQAQGEVALSADIIEYYADHAQRFLAAEPLTPGSGSASVIQPDGNSLGLGGQGWHG
eukprot:gene12932-17220_t